MLKRFCHKCKKPLRVPLKQEYKKASCGACGADLLLPLPIEANEQDFDSIVNFSSGIVVADFWAPWCGPCQMMAPAFKEASQSAGIFHTFVKVDTEQNPSLSARYGIRSIPTLLFFKEGNLIKQQSGALSKEQILTLLRGLA